MEENISKLKRYEFSGVVTDESIAAFYLLLKQKPIFSKELMFSRQKIQSILNAVNDWGLSLGYDISDRLPMPSDINLISLEDYRKIDPKTILSDNAQASGDMIYNTVQVFKSKGRTPNDIVRSITHELVHLVSHRVINIEKKKNGGYIFTETEKGYWHGKDMYLRGINECITELTSKYIIKNLFSGLSGLETIYKPGLFSYSTYLPLFVAIIYKFSEDTGDLPKIIFRELQKGMLVGKMSYLNELINFYKTPEMEEIVNMDPYTDDVDKIISIAEKLGLSSLVNYVCTINTDRKDFRYITNFLEAL